MCVAFFVLSFNTIFFIRFFFPLTPSFSFPSCFSYILELIVLLLLPLLCYLPNLNCVICYHLHSFIVVLDPSLLACFELNPLPSFLLLCCMPILSSIFVVTPIPLQLTCTSSSILCCCSSSIACLLQTQSAYFKLCKVFEVLIINLASLLPTHFKLGYLLVLPPSLLYRFGSLRRHLPSNFEFFHLVNCHSFIFFVHTFMCLCWFYACMLS